LSMLPENLQRFFPNNKATTDNNNLVIIPVVGRDVLVAHGSQKLVVEKSSADIMKFYCQRRLTLGQWQGIDCEVWDLSAESNAMPGFGLVDLRSLLRTVSDEEFSLASRAVQMLEWQKNHQFCGACGQPTVDAVEDHALQCVACNINLYPRISPCIIVVVVDGERCLLGRQANWPEGRFSALAGFLEAGESAEQALHREVFEEVGVHIDNIRYVGSQTWPFPGQLMLGFLADAKTTDIHVDGVEIAEAEWFHYSELPDKLPSIQSMSGRLIADFVKQLSAS
jgi:NAD+ diphosphatase